MSDHSPETGRGARPRAMVLGGVLLLLVLATWASWGFFSRNYVKHLLNQRQYLPALEKLQELRAGNGGDARLESLEMQALAAMAEYENAARVGSEAVASGDAPPEAFYWLSLARYQAGQTSASRMAAEQFLAQEATLPNGANALARAMAGERSLTSPPEIDGLPFRLLFPVEQGTWLGLTADGLARSGNHVLAARLYREAFVRGHRNPESLESAVVSAALAGDFDAAEIYLEFVRENALRSVMEDLSRRRGTAGQVRLRVLGGHASSTGGGQLDIARALAWTLARTGDGNGDLMDFTSATLQGLHEEFPHDATIKICYADALEDAGETSAARELLAQLHETEPSLETWLRLHGRDSTAEDLAEDAAALIEQLNPVALLTGERALITRVEPLAAHQAPQYFVGVPIEIEASGTYIITLIVRGSDSEQQTTPFYIGLEEGGAWHLCGSDGIRWQLCSVQVQLDAGEFQVQISGAPPLTSPPDSDQNLPVIGAVLVTSLAEMGGGR